MKRADPCDAFPSVAAWIESLSVEQAREVRRYHLSERLNGAPLWTNERIDEWYPGLAGAPQAGA